MPFYTSWQTKASLLLIVALIILATSEALLFSDDCKTYQSCLNCTSENGWNGQTCRWCPRDNKCYSPGAISSNPCSSSEDLKEVMTCPSYAPQFSPALGRFAFDFAYQAYPNVIQGALINGTNFRVVSTFTQKCDKYNDCFGYIASSEVNKTIVVAFRGSISVSQIIMQALSAASLGNLVKFDCDRSRVNGEVFVYYKTAMDKFWPKISSRVADLLRQDTAGYRVLVTGHSLGGALASLISQELITKRIVTSDQLTLVTFGQPRVGTYNFAMCHDLTVRQSFRVVHRHDMIAHLPWCSPLPGIACLGSGFNELPFHHGLEIFYDNDMITDEEVNDYQRCVQNEARNCSNRFSVGTYNVRDHVYYYGKLLGWNSTLLTSTRFIKRQ